MLENKLRNTKVKVGTLMLGTVLTLGSYVVSGCEEASLERDCCECLSNYFCIAVSEDVCVQDAEYNYPTSVLENCYYLNCSGICSDAGIHLD